MGMGKLPPPEKIYEAWSALASGRVRLESPPEAERGGARVLSSNGEKEYVIHWDGDVYESTDSASHWQGYPGYPVLAVLMLRGLLPCEAKVARLFANVDWNYENKKARRDYAAALEKVLAGLGLSEDEKARARAAADLAYASLKNLPIKIRRHTRPGKG